MTTDQIELYAIIDSREYGIKGKPEYCAMALETRLYTKLGYMDLDRRSRVNPFYWLDKHKARKLGRSNPLITLSTGKVMRKTRIYSEYDIERAVGEIVGLV